mmetsp:Transcript_1006/g.3051  ORF Transcript_1006/g.3051 Transcript_1006/m.3051 type:complete len:316 (-) Transcript_1006:46-993(-)
MQPGKPRHQQTPACAVHAPPVRRQPAHHASSIPERCGLLRLPAGSPGGRGALMVGCALLWGSSQDGPGRCGVPQGWAVTDLPTPQDTGPMHDDLAATGHITLYSRMLGPWYGAIQAVKEDLPRQISTAHGGYIASHLGLGPTFATGWSNGGYLAMQAVISAGANLFAAVAPISGFQEDGFEAVSRAVPIMMHHAENDRFVNYHGCCGGASSGSCCCSITGPCRGTEEIFHQWANTVNGCDQQAGAGGQLVEAISFVHERIMVSCSSAVGCLANTTLCTHETGGHFNSHGLEHSFPREMLHGILRFFLEVDGQSPL